MRTRIVTLLLGAVLAVSPLSASRAAEPRDLVRATAALALAQSPTDEPPPGRSQTVPQKEREEAARAEAQKKRQEAETPYYKKWWFWALTAVVVGGTVALGAWAVEPSTAPARACSIGVIGCFGDGRSVTR